MNIRLARKLDSVLHYAIGAGCGIVFAMICLLLSIISSKLFNFICSLF